MPADAQPLIGVLGGMGPLATLDFLGKVISLTPARRDQEHVPLIVHQVPQIPDRSGAILTQNDAPFEPMLQGLRRLASAGATVAAIPCNSAHHWYDRLAYAQPLPLLHIADAVAEEIKRRSLPGGRISLLATRGTVHARVYEKRLGEWDHWIRVDEATQQHVDRTIAAVKSGDQHAAAIAGREAARGAFRRGADVLILGCTELPVALSGADFLERCIDSSLALARSCVGAYVRGSPVP